MNREGKDAAEEMKKIEKLDLDELENIAGGREIRKSEWDNLLQVKARLNYTMADLNSSGKYDEIKKLSNRYQEAFYKWKKDVTSSSDESPDVDFRKYFRV